MRSTHRHRRTAGLAALVVAGLALSACTAGSPAGSSGASTAGASATPATSSSAPSSSAAPVVPAARLTLAPGNGASGVDPDSAITAAVAGGTLSSVSLVNGDGKAVTGALAPDHTSWKATEVLGYSKTYTLVAKAANPAGRAVVEKTTFTTLTPPNMTMPYLQRTGGYALTDGATYGIGIVPVVHFDEPITDKAAAQKTLTVTATPAVAGSWYWADDQNVHYRPQTYWKPGTKVTVTANVYGKQVSPGLYGQSDATASFTIGASHISVADDTTHTVSVYFNGTLQRTMPTSMGEHSGETVNGNYISFYTMDGTYTVLEHDNPAMMSSASYGLPANAPGGYAPEPIYYSTKISTDGIYLHELETTIWAQGNTDVSHGCLNLNYDNASWYYNTSQIGDVVEVKNVGGPTIQLWQGGDWSVPWSTWTAGSALH